MAYNEAVIMEKTAQYYYEATNALQKRLVIRNIILKTFMFATAQTKQISRSKYVAISKIMRITHVRIIDRVKAYRWAPGLLLQRDKRNMYIKHAIVTVLAMTAFIKPWCAPLTTPWARAINR